MRIDELQSYVRIFITDAVACGTVITVTKFGVAIICIIIRD